MPTTLTFAGEPVPLDDPLVYDRLERELIKNVYRQSATLTVLKRVQRYRESIMGILTKNRIPTDFFYLAVIESDLSPINPSGKGADGMWQFTESAAKEYGLEMSKYVDERRNVERSTQAASQYLAKMYRKLQNWTLSAAAFNGGLTSLSNSLKNQQVSSFYDLYLTPETQDYIYRILSMKLICESPEKYGYSIRTGEYEAQTRSIPLKNDLNLLEFAQVHNMTYNQLKYYNPWLLYKSTWESTDKYYEQNKFMNIMLEVPVGKTYFMLVTD